MILHPIVKYADKYWVLEKIEEDIATLRRNGESKNVYSSEIEYLKNTSLTP